MTVQERLEDISALSGFSIDIVRKVLNAEQASIIKSLKKGERATLIGRCTLTPCIRQKIKVGVGMVNYIRVQATASNIISDELEAMEKYEKSSEEDANYLKKQDGIATTQIASLV